MTSPCIAPPYGDPLYCTQQPSPSAMASRYSEREKMHCSGACSNTPNHVRPDSWTRWFWWHLTLRLPSHRIRKAPSGLIKMLIKYSKTSTPSSRIKSRVVHLQILLGYHRKRKPRHRIPPRLSAQHGAAFSVTQYPLNPPGKIFCIERLG